MSVTRPLLRPPLRPLLRGPLEVGWGGFNPRVLFANGEQGFLLVNDISTMYQDSAGTIPAVVGQPVGLWLDQSGRGNHFRQTTPANRPTLMQTAGGLYFLRFNGTNHSMQSAAAINFTGTNKMTVLAAFQHSSNAAAGMLLELSSNINTNPGSFYFDVPENTFGAFAFVRNLGGNVAGYLSGNKTPPAPYVMASVFDGSGTSLATEVPTYRLNGVDSRSATAGTYADTAGNFGNYSANMGARAGSSLFFNGDIYCLSTRGALTTSTQIAQAERWLALRQGRTL